jgi:hypothetical protein
MEEKSRNNGLADGRIVEIRATCSSKWRRKNWQKKVQLGLI